MKKILTLLLSCFLLFSCSEGTTKSSSPILKENSIPAKLSWEFYHKYCGEQNANATKNFELLQGKIITWKGQFYAMPSDIKRSRFSDHIMKIKMPKTGSVLSDVTLRFPKQYEKMGAERKVGDEILFQGEIVYLGSGIGDHVVEVKQMKYIPPKKPKKVVR